MTPDKPQQKDDTSYNDSGPKPPLSTLRQDDIDVYLRIATYEDKVLRKAKKFVERAKWLPFSQRFEVYQDSIQYFQNLRNNSIVA